MDVRALTRWFARLPPGSTAAVTGAPGTGKTRTVQAAARAGAFPRRLVFDPYGFRDRLELRRGKVCSPWPGEIGTAQELLEDVRDSAPGQSLLDRAPLELVVSANDLSPKALGRDFSAVGRLVWATGEIDLLCEEAGLYSRQAQELIMRYASGGRHVGSRVVFMLQSIGRLTIEARRYLTHLMMFAAGEPTDVDDARKRCGRAVAAQLQRLEPGDPPITWQLGQAITQEQHR